MARPEGWCRDAWLWPLRYAHTPFIKTAEENFISFEGRHASKQANRQAIDQSEQETGGIDLIFHTNTESGKTDDLNSDPHINISFLNSSGEWASLSGIASIVTDRETVKKYYSPGLKAWLGDLGDGKHNGGPEDPRIGVIRVRTETATYAVVRKNVAARAVDMAQGVVTGNVPAVNKLRELSEGEIETWRASRTMVQ
jgi:general stress protein 26